MGVRLKPSKHVSTALRKAWEARAKKCWLAGGGCFAQLACGGFVGSQAQNQLMYTLESVRRWSGIIMVFNCNGYQQWADSVVIESTQPLKLNEFQLGVNAAMDELYESCNKKFIVSSGYYVVTHTGFDLAAMRDGVVQWFADRGAFDATYCYLQNELKEKLNEQAANA
ncbi:MAG: hypothetical protein Unbinned4162contig1001_40 [Prokaryotic dsDNA virus sp.]|mgnify:CR=1 FL=1|nr:MAG: hypothetical protein Unbinned4162contig1001_40 [Prokaryotic dsDNA virus sp.]|tara:strand:- start:5089 stop:5592 length:504 start_codon:yes stop_codon:yes gene_type:complete